MGKKKCYWNDKFKGKGKILSIFLSVQKVEDQKFTNRETTRNELCENKKQKQKTHTRTHTHTYNN